MWGYYIFLVFLFLTVYGVMLGSMISMFEFIANLPYPENFLGGFKTRSIIMYLFTTVVTYVLCLIRDTKSRYDFPFTVGSCTSCRGSASSRWCSLTWW